MAVEKLRIECGDCVDSVGNPGFIHRVAELFQGAIHAAGLAGDADLAAVVDEFVGELDPVILWDDFLEVLFYVHGVGGLGEFEAAGEPKYMCVNNYAGGDAVPAAQDYVGGLAGYSGELDHFFDGLGDFASEFIDEDLGCSLYILRFSSVEAGGADEALDLGEGGFGEPFGGGIQLEELGGGLVDGDVGGLGGEDGGDGEFEGVAVG